MTTATALLEARQAPEVRPEAPSGEAGADPAPRRPAMRQPGAARPIYRSTKSYDHSEGLSCCFRQWRAAHSHCRLVHGYALAFRFVFATHRLDQNNWCFDFGGLKPIRAWLHEMFDHTMLVAEDDPNLPDFRDLAQKGLVDLRVLPNVGCEATAEYVFDHLSRFIAEQTAGRVWLDLVEVKEHGGNSAIFERGPDPAEA
ncbi:6-carboxytetrahydropterin synthase [Siccirubricoccus sp. G192]|uniref:6-pyruvoyl trahydropterin synthase family protein n=1 Tax=Siccirubricoccus sp. G192 TaxID=2849651 RepID=UPI001C2BF7A9|nr:6-carboxytetrahydropterin synthase [Siccirubricoccus sp. G192]MBV1797788.1 6-carboxytetrahydropterin synthase [Siccirubricoccus sp. G192]